GGGARMEPAAGSRRRRATRPAGRAGKPGRREEWRRDPDHRRQDHRRRAGCPRSGSAASRRGESDAAYPASRGKARTGHPGNGAGTPGEPPARPIMKREPNIMDFATLEKTMREAPLVAFPVKVEQVPSCSGIYTAWLDDENCCFYVG